MRMLARRVSVAFVAALAVLALPSPGVAQSSPQSVRCYVAWDGILEVNVGSQFGYTDSAIRAALDLAKRDGCRVLVPGGTYSYSATLPIAGLKVWGAEDSALLVATNKPRMAFVLSGASPELRGIKIHCPSCELPSGPPTTARLGTGESAAVFMQPGTSGFVVENVSIERAGSAGILNWGGHDGRITGNRIRDTLADAIHLTHGAFNVDVGGNTVTNSGDDFFAVVSYGSDPSPSHDITIHDNVGIGQPWGRGIYLSGYRLKVLRNDIRETYGAAILMESGGYWNTYGAQDVEIAGNLLRLPDRSDTHLCKRSYRRGE